MRCVIEVPANPPRLTNFADKKNRAAMLILNPLYDWTFKYLLDDNALARDFLSAILKMEVEHLETRNIELPLLKEGNPFLSRFDFKAIVRSEGRTREVLIEIQKYRSPDPLRRFRAYLGESYAREEAYADEGGRARLGPLPLIAVYILGYCPPGFDRPYVVVRNQAFDGVDDSPIEDPGRMAELLTHPAYFIVATPPEGYAWRGSRQEALIRLFRQKAQNLPPNPTYELEEDPSDPVARAMAQRLHRGTQDSEVVRQLLAEEDYLAAIGELEQDLDLARRQADEARRLEEEARQREEEARRMAEEARLHEEEARRMAEEARMHEEEARRMAEEARMREEEARRELESSRARSLESARAFLALGLPAPEVARLTGLPEDVVRSLQG